MMTCLLLFFNDTATTEIYTRALHDALPICPQLPGGRVVARRDQQRRQEDEEDHVRVDPDLRQPGHGSGREADEHEGDRIGDVEERRASHDRRGPEQEEEQELEVVHAPGDSTIGWGPPPSNRRSWPTTTSPGARMPRSCSSCTGTSSAPTAPRPSPSWPGCTTDWATICALSSATSRST